MDIFNCEMLYGPASSAQAMLRVEKLNLGALELTGLVLAGGKSSRMGRDKALLKPWGRSGPTLVEHAFELLKSICGSCVVSCRRGGNYPGLPCVEDMEPAFGGPAYGIAAGLEFAAERDHDGVLALACDMPAMRAGVLWKLTQAAAGAPRMWATCFEPAQGGKLEMLVAVYRAAFLPALRKGLASGESSLYRLAPANRRLTVKYGADMAECFCNCNTPEALADFQRLHGGVPLQRNDKG